MTDYTIKERFPQLYAEAVEAVYNWLKYEDYEDCYCDLHNFKELEKEMAEPYIRDYL